MSVSAKQTYRPKLRLEVFYTGGAAKLSPSGQHVACACGDEVKVCCDVRLLCQSCSQLLDGLLRQAISHG